MKCVRVHTRCGQSLLLKAWIVVLSERRGKEEGSRAGSEASEGAGGGGGAHEGVSGLVSGGHSSSLREEEEPPACTTAPPDPHPAQEESSRALTQDPTHKRCTAINTYHGTRFCEVHISVHIGVSQ